MAELSFAWDKEKNAANIRNHGIDFLDAALIFENPRVEAMTNRADYGELRCIALGLSGRQCCTSSTPGAAKNVVRMVSARRASRHDAEKYYVRYSLKAIKRKLSRGASKTRAGAPEAAPVGDDFWKRAEIVMPPGKTSVHLRVDSDVFDWFKKTRRRPSYAHERGVTLLRRGA